MTCESLALVRILKSMPRRISPEMARLILEDTSSSFEKLQQAVSCRDREQIRFWAHYLAASFLEIDDPEGVRFCRLLERLPEQSSPDEVSRLVESCFSRYQSMEVRFSGDLKSG